MKILSKISCLSVLITAIFLGGSCDKEESIRGYESWPGDPKMYYYYNGSVKKSTEITYACKFRLVDGEVKIIGKERSITREFNKDGTTSRVESEKFIYDLSEPILRDCHVINYLEYDNLKRLVSVEVEAANYRMTGEKVWSQNRRTSYIYNDKERVCTAVAKHDDGTDGTEIFSIDETYGHMEPLMSPRDFFPYSSYDITYDNMGNIATLRKFSAVDGERFAIDHYEDCQYEYYE